MPASSSVKRTERDRTMYTLALYLALGPQPTNVTVLLLPGRRVAQSDIWALGFAGGALLAAGSSSFFVKTNVPDPTRLAGALSKCGAAQDTAVPGGPHRCLLTVGAVVPQGGTSRADGTVLPPVIHARLWGAGAGAGVLGCQVGLAGPAVPWGWRFPGSWAALDHPGPVPDSTPVGHSWTVLNPGPETGSVTSYHTGATTPTWTKIM